MILRDLAIGTAARVMRVDGSRAYRRRLLELGLLPGAMVRILRHAPMGDPLELEVRGSCLSIRRADAALVLVELEGKS